MFHTKQNKWNIVDATPYGKDPLKMLADECHRQGIKLFFYHSQLDWHNPDYYPRGRTGQTSGRPDSGDWNTYLDFMDAQLTELLTNYGPIGGIWFDGMWDKPDADWRLQRTYSLIHRLQPAALVGSNHHQTPFEGEDFQMFEKDLPGQNETGFSRDAKVSELPLETCDTINRSWGYNASDSGYKSTAELIRYLARAAGYGANFLLNIGPRPDGTIQPEFVERLKQMGAWLDQYGESIYATERGPIGPRRWGVTTQKGGKVYVHLLDQPDELLALPSLPKKVAKATLLKDGKPVEFDEHRWGLLLRVPLSRRDAYDTVVALEMR
jgi:alpha-L-fucosidase